MKNLFLLLTFTIGGFTSVNAQKVFSVNYESQADVKVFVVDYESQAKTKVFFVKHESQADLNLYFVDYESQGGWKNSSKKAEMY